MSDVLLRLQNITQRFGGLIALHDVSFSVNKGEIAGLIGPNGAGKTTAFNAITGTIPPSSGEVVFNGKKISGLSPSKIVMTGLARTFQSTSTYPEQSVTENIYRGMLSRISGSLLGVIVGRQNGYLEIHQLNSEIEEILELTGLVKWRNSKAGSLPYGLQKILGIAVALASHPTMLLLDEPAAGLNHEECNALVILLRELQKKYGLTLLLVEHHMALVMELCQRIFVLEQGKLIAEGTPEAIRNNSAVVEAYLGAPDYAHA